MKSLFLNMSKRKVVEELHKATRRNFKRRHVIIKGYDDLWQADLVEMIPYSEKNNGFNYLMTVIDAFSKFAWVVPMKNKKGITISKGMDEIFTISSRIPKNLQTDDGKEFFNTNFKSLMEKHKINHYSTFSSLKASIIERFNRTFKEKMWKEFSFNGSYKWINIYKKLLYDYNHSYHRTIKCKPADVNKKNSKSMLKLFKNKNEVFSKSKFKVGDNVRISKYKHVFEKGYTPNWTTEVFKIRKVQATKPITYLLEDFQGKPIQGGFYELELLKSDCGDVYLVEKVLQTKGNKVFVKWLGFPPEHNSWIDKNKIL